MFKRERSTVEKLTKTGENPDANAVIQELATVLASETSLRTEQWGRILGDRLDGPRWSARRRPPVRRPG